MKREKALVGQETCHRERSEAISANFDEEGIGVNPLVFGKNSLVLGPR